MSVEYHWFPAKENRIIAGFARDEDGKYKYDAPYWCSGRNRSLHEFGAERLTPDQIDDLDRDFLTYKENGQIYSDAFFVSRDFIENHAEITIRRIYMPVDNAAYFVNEDYDPYVIEMDEIEWMSAEAYATCANAMTEPWVQVAYLPTDTLGYQCEILSHLLCAYPDADGFIVMIG